MLLLFQSTLEAPSTIAVGAGSGTFTGYAPSFTWKVAGQVGSGTFQGYSPSLSVAERLSVGVGFGTFEGYEPTLVLPGFISPDPGQGAFTGYEPTLLEETTTVYQETPAGRSKRRRRYLVEIDGQEFWVNSVQEAEALLNRAKKLAEQAAAKSAEDVVNDALRRARRIGKAVGVEIKTPRVSGSPELEDALEATRKALEKLYREAEQAAELRMLLELEAERDEEDVLLLL